MLTGVTYMGHHNPRHLATDLDAMVDLRLDDVLVAAEENDFVHFTGKIRFTPELARRRGLRPIAVFWGALNLFGGGRSSQFLLEHPEGRQVGRDNAPRAAGCYVNPVCVGRIEQMIDTVVDLGFAAYFVDEPTPLRDCYCPACEARFREWHGGDLAHAAEAEREVFRQRCVVEYVRQISEYCKRRHPGLETMTCLMPVDQAMWADTARIEALDNLGTDLYWTNSDRDVRDMVPIVQELAALCRQHHKVHHEWLQCWRVDAGSEGRVRAQGEVLVELQPDALYVWAWEGQIGTTESCDDPARAWAEACAVLRLAKQG